MVKDPGLSAAVAVRPIRMETGPAGRGDASVFACRRARRNRRCRHCGSRRIRSVRSSLRRGRTGPASPSTVRFQIRLHDHIRNWPAASTGIRCLRIGLISASEICIEGVAATESTFRRFLRLNAAAIEVEHPARLRDWMVGYLHDALELYRRRRAD